jgi:hypothetical protein
MKERPILFSGAMVRALLDGSKTQTRRVMNRQPPEGCGIHYMLGDESWMPEDKRTPLRHHWEAWGGPLYEQRPDGHLCGTHSVRCPYGAPGDRLWVRETFFAWGRWETRFSAKKGRDEWHFVDMTAESYNGYLYAADGVRDTQAFIKRRSDPKPMYWKRPAIFMPRAASRITQEITEVRVERLQDISEADASDEGVRQLRDESGCWAGREGPGNLITPWPTALEAFRDIWESINGPDSWDENPWVWAVEFKPPTTA